MKKSIGVLAALLLVGSVFALPASAAPPTVTEGVEVTDVFGDPEDVWAADAQSTIRRTPNGMTVYMDAQGLDPDNVYSMWWFIIADVVKLEGECVPGSIFVLNATGAVANSHGDATFAGHLSTGPIGEANGADILANVPIASADGSFDDPLMSHVYNILVDHGDKHDLQDGTTVEENMHTIIGGLGDILFHDNLPAELAAFCGE